MAISILWALLALIFLISELFAPGMFFFLGLFFGSVYSCIIALLGAPFVTQLIQFIAVSAIFYVFALYRFRKKKTAIKKDPYISPLDALIGQEIIIHTQLDYGTTGYALINGCEWRVQWNKDQSINLPQKAYIVTIKGAHLKVLLL